MRRRTLLKNMMAIGAAAAINPIASSNADNDSCEIQAQALAQALMKKYGSLWKVKVDNLNEFVLVYREVLPPKA